MTAGNYTMCVSGYSDKSLLGQIFTNETKLFFDSKQISMFIQTNKPYYNQRQTGRQVVTGGRQVVTGSRQMVTSVMLGVYFSAN